MSSSDISAQLKVAPKVIPLTVGLRGGSGMIKKPKDSQNVLPVLMLARVIRERVWISATKSNPHRARVDDVVNVVQGGRREL